MLVHLKFARYTGYNISYMPLHGCTNFILAIMPAPKGAGRGREYESMHELACMSREAPRFLALEPVSFSTTATYSFVLAVWGCDQICLSIETKTICWCSLAIYRYKDDLGSP